MSRSLLFSALLLLGCDPAPAPPPPGGGVPGLSLGDEIVCADPADGLPGFTDVTVASGIAHQPPMPVWTDGGNGVTSVLMEMTGGFVVADLDSDGLLDLLFTGYRAEPRLYLGLGALQFEEVDAGARGLVTGGEHVNGGSAADVDADGDLDVWLGTYAGGLLFRNDGGTFVEVGGELGVTGAGNQLSGAWADPDRDGDLDLYVAAHSPGSAGPGLDYPNHPDALWIQGEDGTFTDASSALYPDGVAGQGFIGGWFDADGDGWQDLYVVNDGGTDPQQPPNRYFANVGGTLTPQPNAGAEIGMFAMGLALGDMDNDGDLDAHVSDAGPSLLLRNEGGHLFTDVSLEVEQFSDGGAGDISWGTTFFDHDNDGVLELFTAFGHMPTKDGRGPNDTVNRAEMPDQLWRRSGTVWVDVAPEVGVADPAWSRTAQAVDLDGDGFLELLSWSLDEGPKLFASGCNGRAWLEVRLEDTTGANPDALGARIIASDPSGSVLRQIEAGSTGVMSGGPPVAHMGLGSADVADVTVRWPDGETTLYTDVPTRRAITITR